MAHIAGIVAAGLIQNPVRYADFVTTTTHKTLRGPRGGMILCKSKYASAIDDAVFPGMQGGPLMHIIAGKAVCFKEAMQPRYKEYITDVLQNAKALASALMNNGIDILTGGTDNHLMILDLRNKNISGNQVEYLLHAANLTTNMIGIPGDTRTDGCVSGIRIGTPAVTTRGMGVESMELIAGMIADIIDNGENAVERVKKKAVELNNSFPLYTK